MGNSKEFWGVTVSEVIKMDYELLPMAISEASGLSETDIITTITKRRMNTSSDAERLACSRILSALIGGPDQMA